LISLERGIGDEGEENAARPHLEENVTASFFGDARRPKMSW